MLPFQINIVIDFISFWFSLSKSVIFFSEMLTSLVCLYLLNKCFRNLEIILRFFIFASKKNPGK